jgi:hypothetical protein
MLEEEKEMNRVDYFNELGEINARISALVDLKVDIDRKICSLETRRYDLKHIDPERLTGSILASPDA